MRHPYANFNYTLNNFSKKSLLILLNLILSWATSAYSTIHSDTIFIANKNDLVTAKDQIRYFIDSTNALNIADVSSSTFNEKFNKHPSEIPNFKGNIGKVWFKFTIVNHTSEPIYLSLTNQYIHRIDVFGQSGEDPPFEIVQTGFYRPFKSRHLDSRNFLINLVDSEKSAITIYGCLDAPEGPFWVPLKLGALQAVVNENRISEFISISVLGIMLAMIFYNFFIFSYLKDKVYLYYVFYAIASVVYFLFTNTFLFEWFWPDNPDLNKSLLPIGFLFFTVVHFVNKALDVKQNTPWLYKVSFVLYFFAVILCLTGTLVGLHSLFFVNLMGMSAPVYISLAVLFQLKRKSFYIFLFLIGWAPLMVMIIVFSLMLEGFFYNEFIRLHGIELCSVWEAIIFSLALGYRYSSMKKNVTALQAEKIQLIASQNFLLEQRVQQRTEEITAQNQELTAQQEEITAQRDVIEIQKNSLEEKVKSRTLELAKSNNQLKIQLHKLNQFSFITAHNLRAPVARIMGLASIFDKQNPSNPVNTTLLEKTSEAVQDLDKVIHDLGFILQIQNDIPIEKSSIDLVELIESIKLKFEEEIAKTSATINVALQKDILVTNKDYLNNILTNLISNSLKHRQSENPAEITITFQELESVYRLTVEDNGAGIDTDYFASKIFEPFQRFNDFTKGTGLGLYLVKTQVTNLGGRINLVSTLGKGTKVTIIIPKTTALL
jgi:signal transduction histidine kinase